MVQTHFRDMGQLWSRRAVLGASIAAALKGARDWDVEITQLTHGPQHHFFGYIGHVKNSPWNGNGRYMVLLRTGFQDHMPAPHEAADVVLVDTKENNKVTAVEKSHAWNPQQGTMFYWNPRARDTQLIFNDRDLKTNRELEVVARHDRGRREAANHLVRDVRTGEDCDRPARDERRQPCPRRRVEAFRQAEDRRVTRKGRDDVAEDTARDGEHDEVGLGDGGVADRRRADTGEVGILRVPRVSSRRGDRLGLNRVARGERHLVAVVAQQARERRSPRACADDDGSHSLVTKSMETGTPSRPKRARSSFSTQ